MKKKSTVPKIVIEKKPGVFNLKFTKGDKSIVKTKLSKIAVLDFYFQNLENNIKDFTAEELYDKYKQIWSSYTLKSVYIDSWGHKWPNCFVSDKSVYEYLNDKIKLWKKQQIK